MGVQLKDLTTLRSVEDYIEKGEYCGQDTIDLWKENQSLKSKLANETVRKEESFRQEDHLLQENKELKRKKFWKFDKEEFWYFSEDEPNYLDTLICPVVISPDYLRALLE